MCVHVGTSCVWTFGDMLEICELNCELYLEKGLSVVPLGGKKKFDELAWAGVGEVMDGERKLPHKGFRMRVRVRGGERL